MLSIGLTDSYTLNPGDNKVMGGLHKGIIGMRHLDARKITIPLSIQLDIKITNYTIAHTFYINDI